MNPNALAGALCGMVIGIAIGSLIGAVIFRAAVAMFNAFVGGPGSPKAVEEPTIGKAFNIVLVTSILNAVVGFFIGIVVGMTAVQFSPNEDVNPRMLQLIAQLISLPFGILILATVTTLMMPTSFGRGLLISLCFFIIALLVAIVIGGLIAGVIFLTR